MNASPSDVPFAGVVSTGMSSYDGDAALLIGTDDATRARIAQLVNGASVPADRAPIAAFQGSQRTAGYLIRIERIERDADRLIVHAAFTAPPAGSVVAQVLTSPAAVVSIAASDARGVSEAVLLDESGAERARSATR